MFRVRLVIYECEFPLLLGDITTWKTFRNTLVFVRKIHQSLVDSRHKRPETETLDVFFVVNQSKLQNKRSYWDDMSWNRLQFYNPS